MFPVILHSNKGLVNKRNNNVFYKLADVYTLDLTHRKYYNLKDDQFPRYFQLLHGGITNRIHPYFLHVSNFQHQRY